MIFRDLRCLSSASALPKTRYCPESRTKGRMGQVQKPKCDRRSYQDAVLANGLRVLAIQDKDAVFAAACANVQAGYFDDDLQLPGAAHFLEHMVHLGSEAFPDEREYKAFLAAHAGSSNASTSEPSMRHAWLRLVCLLFGSCRRAGAARTCACRHALAAMSPPYRPQPAACLLRTSLLLPPKPRHGPHALPLQGACLSPGWRVGTAGCCLVLPPAGS